MLGRGAVGVAHAEVDDVFATAARGGLHLAGDVEDVGGKALNEGKLVHDDSSVKARDQGTERTRDQGTEKAKGEPALSERVKE